MTLTEPAPDLRDIGAEGPDAPPPSRAWQIGLVVLIVGYLTLSRSFAHLGMPSRRLFIGEVALGAVLLLRPGWVFGPWMRGLANRTIMRSLPMAVWAWLVFGIFQFVRGVSDGYRFTTAMQNLVVNVYPLFIFIGLAVGSSLRPGFLQRVVRIIAWSNGIYGLAYLLVLNRADVFVPGAVDIRLFGQPSGSAIAILGLLITERRIGRAAPLLVLNAGVLLGLQVRAEWLGLLMALVAFGLLLGKMHRVVLGVAVLAGLLSLAFVMDLRVPGSLSRGGEISAREIAGRALAPFDEELAATLTDRAAVYAGTAEWRTRWWSGIWAEVNSQPNLRMVGLGYGFPLSSLAPQDISDIVRSPHNIVLYVLGHGGWLGVGLLSWFLFALLGLAIRAARRGDPRPAGFAVALWVLTVVMALFGNHLETPFGAIPFYLLVGLAVAQSLKGVGERGSGPPLDPAPGSGVPGGLQRMGNRST